MFSLFTSKLSGFQFYALLKSQKARTLKFLKTLPSYLQRLFAYIYISSVKRLEISKFFLNIEPRRS